MADLPLYPNLNHYRGCKENLRRKAADQNRTAHRICDHLNRLIADNPDEVQQYIYGMIAIELGVSVDEVRRAVPGGGYNGITLGVREPDRQLLAPYESKKVS